MSSSKRDSNFFLLKMIFERNLKRVTFNNQIIMGIHKYKIAILQDIRNIHLAISRRIGTSFQIHTKKTLPKNIYPVNDAI
jgi:hypothetical protein